MRLPPQLRAPGRAYTDPGTKQINQTRALSANEGSLLLWLLARERGAWPLCWKISSVDVPIECRSNRSVAQEPHTRPCESSAPLAVPSFLRSYGQPPPTRAKRSGQVAGGVHGTVAPARSHGSAVRAVWRKRNSGELSARDGASPARRAGGPASEADRS